MSKHDDEGNNDGSQWGTALGATSAPISIHDADYRIIKVNAAFLALVQRVPTDIIGRKCYEVIHGTPQRPAYCPHSRALQSRTRQKEEFFEPHLGIGILVSCYPVFGADGKPIGSIHVADETAQTSALSNTPVRNVFTERQKQILKLLCGGRTVKQIAAQLKMSSKTVAYHKYRMMKKLSARSLAELISLVLTRDGYLGRGTRRDGRRHSRLTST